MKKDVLDQYHPITSFAYFTITIIASVIFFHPIASAISLVAAVTYGVWLHGIKAVKFFCMMPILIAVITVVVNALFVHKGITVLFYIKDIPITKEAMIYGVCAGMMTASVLMWFYCAGIIMTSDKFIYIFGRILPAASLMFSMIMRFVPRFVNQAKKISVARKAMGCNDGKKASGAMKTLSVMTTWALENSIDTADSMKARGYGHSKRTRYSLFFWEKRDVVAIVVIAILIVVGALGKIKFSCYPIISASSTAIGIAAITFMYFIPMLLNMTEEIKWKYFQSKI